jgi:3D (Asp-Asp-Asp) domain-containing protein
MASTRQTRIIFKGATSMFGKMKVLALTGALAATAFAATGAQAAGWIVGLVDGKSIVTIDPASRKVASKVEVKGAGPLTGIDVRPADGMLYGVAGDGTIFTIDIKSGQATMKSKMSETLKPGVTATVDFNPVADRLRVMGSDGTSLRVNVDDGKATVDGSHKYKDGDANAGKTPKVVAGAYTNSSKGTKATALYNIDAATGALVTQAPPNDGVLNTVGSLGMPVSGPVAFNIVSSGEDKNDAWLVAGGALYAIDLKTGKASMVGKIEGLSGNLGDIAWVD